MIHGLYASIEKWDGFPIWNQENWFYLSYRLLTCCDLQCINKTVKQWGKCFIERTKNQDMKWRIGSLGYIGSSEEKTVIMYFSKKQ